MSNRRGVRGSSRTVEVLEHRRLLSIGYADPGALIDFPIGTDGVLLRYTRYGDADLNSIIDIDDFNALYRNFLRANATWEQGDFTYDGVVNLSDFNRLAANFGFSAGPDGPTPADWAALAGAVGVQPSFSVSSDGTLIVTGDTFPNRITVDSSRLAQMAAEHPGVRIRRIHIDAGAGDDIIEMRVSLPATIIGGKGNDHITAGGRADLISGGAGNDFINGGGGNDTIEGLAGDDQLSGSAGADSILGGDGHDVINGGSGDDTLRGGAGNDALSGNDGHNLFYGDAGADQMWGSPGRDRFVCIDDGAVDRIFGFSGFDRVRGHDPLDIVDLGAQ